MKKLLTIEHLIHAVIILCACTSLENIETFFSAKGHPAGASWLISITLGLGVVATSIMLTHIDPKQSRSTFIWLLASVSAFALISGGIQSAQYQSHGVEAPWSWVLGFSLPLSGEVLLAYAASAYRLYMRNNLLSTIESDTQSSVLEAIKSGLGSIKLDELQAQVNQLASSLANQSLARASSSLLEQQPLGLLPEVAAGRVDSTSWQVPEEVYPSRLVDSPSSQGVSTNLLDLQPGRHQLVSKKSQEVWQIEAVVGDKLKIVLTNQPSFTREVSFTRLDRYYEVVESS